MIRPCRFEFLAPTSLREAVRLFEQHGDGARFMAGGTDLLVGIRRGLARPTVIVSLARIKRLDRVRYKRDSGLLIGATARLADVARNRSVRRHYPSLAQAIGGMATVQVRNMGTVAGNICNASPCADTVPMLMALDARVETTGPDGERSISLRELFEGPGETVLSRGEIVTSVIVPPPPEGSGTSYQRLAPRGKVDVGTASVAVLVVMKDGLCVEARVFLGAVAPVVMRASEAEAVLEGSRLQPLDRQVVRMAAERAAEQSQPISDVRAGAKYRRMLVAVATSRAVEKAAQSASCAPRRNPR